MIDFMKRDIDEFTQTFQEETKNAVSNAAGVLRDKLQMDDSESTANKMKRSVSTLLGTVSQAFTLTREESEEELCVIRNNEPVILDRVQSQVYTMQIEPKTYLEDPQPLEEYEQWLRTFDLERMQPELSDTLINNPEVQSLYTKLVPAMVSHIVFWHRYFFKLHQMNQLEERKQALLQRASDEPQQEEIQWDDEDAAPTKSEMTDQLATQILNEYEAECRERKRIEDGKIGAHNLPADSQTDDSKCSSANNESILSSSLSSFQISTKDFDTDDDTKLFTADDKSLHSKPKNLKEELGKDVTMLTTKEKGDLVVVLKNPNDRISPSSSNKESSNDDEWEKDFELEVTEEDVQAAQTLSSTVEGSTARQQGEDEDWENWE